MPQYAPCYKFARLLVQLPRVEPGHDPNTALGAMNGQAGMRFNQQLCIYGPQIKFSL